MRTELANIPVESMAGRVRQVQAFFGERSQEQGLRGALSFRSPWLPEGFSKTPVRTLRLIHTYDR
jgi:hypothetical protein